MKIISKKILHKQRLKTFSVGLTAFFSIFCLISSQVGSTISYFSDTESSLANALQAGSLDFSVDTDGSIDANIGLEGSGSATIIPIVVPVSGSFPVEYRVMAQKISGPDAFCSAINVSATTSPFIYTGPLLSLSTASTTSTDSWPLELFITASSSGILNGDICAIDLLYYGWVDGEDGGYDDEERVSLTLHAVVPVIEEVVDEVASTTDAVTTVNFIVNSSDDDVLIIDLGTTTIATTTATTTEEDNNSDGTSNGDDDEVIELEIIEEESGEVEEPEIKIEEETKVEPEDETVVEDIEEDIEETDEESVEEEVVEETQVEIEEEPTLSE